MSASLPSLSTKQDAQTDNSCMCGRSLEVLRNFGKVQCSASPGPVCARFVPPQTPSETQSPDDVVGRIRLSPLIFLGQNPIYGCSNGLDRACPFPLRDDDSWSCEAPSVKTCHGDDDDDHHQHHCVHLSSTRHFLLEPPNRRGKVSSGLVPSLWRPPLGLFYQQPFSLDPVVPFLQPLFQCRTNLGLFAVWFATTAR